MNENMIFNIGGSGGGAALNFKVVGNPQPAAPGENTIWLNTDVPIGAWYFSATQPENLNEGDVWFPTGASSPVAFSATKKNPVMVYPLSAKQMVSGSLVDVEAKSYQGGEWTDWWDGRLYDSGDQIKAITGGWEQNTSYYHNDSGSTMSNTGTVTFNDSNIVAAASAGKSAIVSTANAINVGSYKTLAFEVDIGSLANYYVSLMPAGFYNCYSEGVAKKTYSASGTHELDISELSGSYYICIVAFNGRTVTVHDVWLER